MTIYKAAYDLLEQQTDLAMNLPKFFRYSIGTRMVDLDLDLLGNIYRANMSQKNRAEVLTDLLIDSIGRQATAWKNSEKRIQINKQYI